MPQTGRRNALKLLSGSFALASFPWADLAMSEEANPRGATTPPDGRLAILFDGEMRTRVLFRAKALTP